jgi:hypothetical protein
MWLTTIGSKYQSVTHSSGLQPQKSFQNMFDNETLFDCYVLRPFGEPVKPSLERECLTHEAVSIAILLSGP